jgi:hypothetical protein
MRSLAGEVTIRDTLAGNGPPHSTFVHSQSAIEIGKIHNFSNGYFVRYCDSIR